eukprot:189394_1
MSAHDEWDITCFEPLPWSVFAWVIMNLSTIFVCAFGAYVVYLTWVHMQTLHKKFKIMCTLIILLFISATIQWSIHVTSSYYCIFKFQLWLDLGLVALFCYQLGLSILYLVFVLRLHHAFHGTPMASSQWLFGLFVLGFALQVFFASMVMYYFYEYPPQEWYLALRAIVAFGVTNSLFAIVLLIVFFRKILFLSDETVLKAAIRLVICAALGLLSTNVASILSIIRSVDDGEIQWTAHVMFKALDTVMNLISLYLQFPYGIAAYNKCFGRLSSVWEKNVASKHAIMMKNTPSAPTTATVDTAETEPTTTAQTVQNNATADDGTVDSMDKKVSTVDSVDNGQIQFVLH